MAMAASNSSEEQQDRIGSPVPASPAALRAEQAFRSEAQCLTDSIHALAEELTPAHRPNDLEMLFEDLGASTLLLQSWKGTETTMLQSRRGGDGLRLGGEERRITMTFLYRFVRTLKMDPQTTWFQAVSIFDMFLLRAPQETTVGSVPAVAVAIVKMLKKVDVSYLDMSGCELHQYAELLGASLRQLGHHVPRTSQETVTHAERTVLSSLQWQVDVPSIHSWLEKYCVRLGVLTNSKYTPILKTAREASLFYGRTIATQRTTNHSMPPRLLAMGLLTFGIAGAHLHLNNSSPDNRALEVAGLMAVAADAEHTEISDACKLLGAVFSGVPEKHRVHSSV